MLSFTKISYIHPMKHRYLIVLFACFALGHAQYRTMNVGILGLWDDPMARDNGFHGQRYSGCYGWTDPLTSKEYAIVGATAGTYFLDISDPSNILQIDYVAGALDSCIWREYKVYDHYCYMVSDDDGANTFQIFDLSTLPTDDSVRVVKNDDVTFQQGHTAYIDGTNLYVNSVTLSTADFHSLGVYDLSADPENPVLLRYLDDDYPAIGHVHDAFILNDTVYASCGFDAFYVFHWDGTNFIQIGNIPTYPDQGYNHSSYMQPGAKTMVMVDEVPSGMAAKVVDWSVFSMPSIASIFESHPDATPHNPYFKGHFCFISSYEDGLQIFDIFNPTAPVLSGYFDTHYQNDDTTFGWDGSPYRGNWGAFLEYPSGSVIALDMQNGLFVLNANAITGTDASEIHGAVTVYPNPGHDYLALKGTDVSLSGAPVRVLDVNGRLMAEFPFSIQGGGVRTTDWPAGAYAWQVQGANGRWLTGTWIKQ